MVGGVRDGKCKWWKGEEMMGSTRELRVKGFVEKSSSLSYWNSMRKVRKFIINYQIECDEKITEIMYGISDDINRVEGQKLNTN